MQSSPASLQCVVVLYGRSFHDSETLQSLALLPSTGFPAGSRLLVYDNSPQPSIMPSRIGSLEVEYLHDPTNPGVAKAYCTACERAQRAGLQWLLLLDQDTLLDMAFLSDLIAAISRDPAPEVAAIVPRLLRDGMVISPQRVGRLHNLPVAPECVGVAPYEITALNAGACIRTSAYPRQGELPSAFPLDYHDHAMFFAMQRSDNKVYLLGTALTHRLSLKRLDTEMSVDRYRNVLYSEVRFIRATGWGGGMLVHRLRLLKRAAGQFLRLTNKQFGQLTLRAALVLGDR